MKLVRGTNVYPRAVEAIVREYDEIDEFQIHLYTAEGIRDEIEVLVEIPDRRPATTRSLARARRRRWPRRTRVCGSASNRSRTRSLPRFELKAKRVLDEREVVGGAGERKQA